MTQLAEKQTQSIDTLQNDQIDLAKIKSFEQHASSPLFMYTEEVDEGAVVGSVYAKSMEDGGRFDAANFRITQNGDLYWSVDSTTPDESVKRPNAVSLVLARENGTVEQLDSNDTAGWVDDLAPKDILYVLPTAACEIASNSALLTKEGLDQLASAKDHELDVVRVSLDQSTALEPTVQPVVAARAITPKTVNDNLQNVRLRKQNEKRQKKEAAMPNKAVSQLKAPVSKLKTRMDAIAASGAIADPSASGIDALTSAPVAPVTVTIPASSNPNKRGNNASSQSEKARGWSKEQTAAMDKIRARRNGGAAAVSTTPTAALDQVGPARTNLGDGGPLMEHMRLARNVEKYTDKVASYEEIAAEALAKRMKGRLFKPLRRKSQEESEKFDDTMRMLDRFTMALDNSLMKQMILEGKTDEEAAELLAEHQQARAEARAERNRAELTKGKVASWLDKYANLSTKKKIAFGIGAGAVIAAAGAGLAAAGGAAAVAGGVGLAVVKVGKTYAQKRAEIYKVDKDQVLSPDTTETDKDGNVTKRSVREQVIAARDHHRDQREASIHKADRNKKIAAGLATVAGIALGAGIVTKVVEHGDEIRGLFDKKIDFNQSAAPDQTDVAAAPKLDQTPEPKLPPKVIEHDFAPSAQTIDLGEGWLQTFNEAGITNVNEQYALLNNQALMQELANKGLAYRDANIGGWGINMTADGKMPADALKLITDFANRDGYNLAS